MAGWSGSDRRATLPKDWPKIRAQVLKRDGHACVNCGEPANQVDHVGDRMDHSPGNLASLCFLCHQRKTASQSVAARRRLAAAKYRPQEKHPGLR
jgi:5-methylcytosine-specific restriction endonuclease McrA